MDGVPMGLSSHLICATSFPGFSILDAGYRSDMTIEEAKSLGLQAIRHATYRDAFSGGYINIFLVRSTGWEQIAKVDSGFLELHTSKQDKLRPKVDR